ncbi:MAG: response regulator [Candidatus Melainabacteria bacterium]|nr:response regulator [Candidatus Melainabacteria bacterium]
MSQARIPQSIDTKPLCEPPALAEPVRCYRLMIVEDDEVIRDSLVNYLEQYHEAPYQLKVDACCDGNQAFAQLNAGLLYDLVISDIHLPGPDGFAVLDYAQQVQPQAQKALITAYHVEDYIRTAKEKGFFNIIAKAVPFNYQELSTVINNLLNPSSAFGLANYLPEGTSVDTFSIQNSEDIMTCFHTLRKRFEQVRVKNVDDLCTAVIEAITNAVYHANKNEAGEDKYEKGSPIEALLPTEYVTVQYAETKDCIGISIIDQGGKLTGKDILYWMERNVSGEGLLDSHGRGLFLIHHLVDRLIVNLKPGHCTEIIMLDYFGLDYQANKPVYINLL